MDVGLAKNDSKQPTNAKSNDNFGERSRFDSSSIRKSSRIQQKLDQFFSDLTPQDKTKATAKKQTKRSNETGKKECSTPVAGGSNAPDKNKV